MTPEKINELVEIAQSTCLDDLWLAGLVERQYKHISTRLAYYRFLYHLVRELQPALCLEIGVEYGLASAHMARAAQEYGGHVIGIDLHFRPIPAGQIPGICGNYDFIIGDSTSVDVVGRVRALTDQYGKLGVVFQDSSHHYDPSVLEWCYYAPLLADGGVWLCDDITAAFFEEGVDQASMEVYFDERPGTKLKFKDVLHYGNTMGVIL